MARQDYVNSWGRGGHVFKGPKGPVKAANISSHKTAGLVLDRCRAQARVDARRRPRRPAVRPQMQRHIYFAKMTDQDFDAIVAWVRTIPPVE